MKRVKGIVKNHVVVLEEGAQLPEGTMIALTDRLTTMRDNERHT